MDNRKLTKILTLGYGKPTLDYGKPTLDNRKPTLDNGNQQWTI